MTDPVSVLLTARLCNNAVADGTTWWDSAVLVGDNAVADGSTRGNDRIVVSNNAVADSTTWRDDRIGVGDDAVADGAARGNDSLDGALSSVCCGRHVDWRFASCCGEATVEGLSCGVM